MADARHRFVPTEQPSPARAVGRRAVSKPLIRAGTSWAVVLAVAALIGRPFFHPSGAAGDIPSRFAAHRAQFQLLKDMLLAEPSVTSVGADNVREYWLFDGRWSSPRFPGRFLSRSEMLEAVALTPERYEAYLDLLKTVGGYRAAQSGVGRNRRVAVHLFPSSKGDASSARAVYAPLAAPARAVPLDDGWSLETDDR